MLSNKQRGVFRNMLLAFVITVVGFAMAVVWKPLWLMPMDGPLAALGSALKWDILLVICLAGNIAFIARHRFFTPEDIDSGGLTDGTERVHLYQAMLQNTLEQTILGLATHAIWSLTMPQSGQGVIAVAAILFCSGRLLFWSGYTQGAEARALGSGLTFYPSVLMLLILCIRQLPSESPRETPSFRGGIANRATHGQPLTLGAGLSLRSTRKGLVTARRATRAGRSPRPSYPLVFAPSWGHPW